MFGLPTASSEKHTKFLLIHGIQKLPNCNGGFFRSFPDIGVDSAQCSVTFDWRQNILRVALFFTNGLETLTMRRT